MVGRKVTTTVTLLVLVAVLGVMAVIGYRSATTPLPGLGGKEDPSCAPAEKNVKRTVSRGEVQVSVFNASGRGGLAGSTLDKIEAAGFKAGNAGNAPKGARVRTAVVWTTKENDTSAKLVALAFGKATKVVVTESDLGPGIDVLVGNRYRGLDRKAPRKINLPAAVESCIEVN